MDYIIVGNGVHAELIKKYIESLTDTKITAFAVDRKYVNKDKIQCLPVVAIEEIENYYTPDRCELYMGIGYKQMGEIRKSLFYKCKKKGYHFKNFIHPTAILPSEVVMGEGNIILESVIIEENSVLGDANLMYGGSMIGHDSLVGSFNTFAGQSMCAGQVKIADNCFLGVGSAVADHAVIGSYVLIGAMAYAFKDMEDYSVVKSPRSIIDTSRSSIDY